MIVKKECPKQRVSKQQGLSVAAEWEQEVKEDVADEEKQLYMMILFFLTMVASNFEEYWIKDLVFHKCPREDEDIFLMDIDI